ncbi:50S ribosomal protein L25 [uncultured Bdellovibrio sp.]|uniref:50S ribosomal protein L25 n=1 Tax=Bdellovibrio sp. HCB-162 TaxID=3394234 RepID=UPI0025F39CCE|nr:50S ribosomal protein L25 [uncultured Bdellovibrio sp.]
MKNRIELNVEPREIGKHNSRALRNSRNVPAVIYGAVEPINVAVGEKEIVKYNTRAYENALFTLKSNDKKANGIVVLVKSVDVHPLSRRPQHVDFFALDLKKAVRVNVEVRLEGKPIGLSEGGLLNVVLRSVEVEVLPTDIPEFLTADISNLGVGDALHVSDLQVSGSVKVITGAEQTIAVVNAQEEEVVATPAAAPAAAATPAAAPAAAKAPAAKK